MLHAVVSKAQRAQLARSSIKGAKNGDSYVCSWHQEWLTNSLIVDSITPIILHEILLVSE